MTGRASPPQNLESFVLATIFNFVLLSFASFMCSITRRKKKHPHLSNTSQITTVQKCWRVSWRKPGKTEEFSRTQREKIANEIDYFQNFIIMQQINNLFQAVSEDPRILLDRETDWSLEILSSFSWQHVHSSSVQTNTSKTFAWTVVARSRNDSRHSWSWAVRSCLWGTTWRK